MDKKWLHDDLKKIRFEELKTKKISKINTLQQKIFLKKIIFFFQ